LYFIIILSGAIAIKNLEVPLPLNFFNSSPNKCVSFKTEYANHRQYPQILLMIIYEVHLLKYWICSTFDTNYQLTNIEIQIYITIIFCNAIHTRTKNINTSTIFHTAFNRMFKFFEPFFDYGIVVYLIDWRY